MASAAERCNTVSFIHSPGPPQYYGNQNDERTKLGHSVFGACYNCMYLFKNLIKLSYSAWYIIAKRISSVHYFNKGFLITLGRLYCKQSSATRSKCPTQLPYAHSQVTSGGPAADRSGPERICPTFRNLVCLHLCLPPCRQVR